MTMEFDVGYQTFKIFICCRKMATARNRVYAVIIKLCTKSSKVYKEIMQGRAIWFPHAGPEALGHRVEEMRAQELPRLPPVL